MRSPLKVVFPNHENDNPYLGLMTDALRDLGVQVGFLPRRSLPFLHDLRKSRRPDVIHLQWQHGYFLGRNAASSAIRTGLFFAQILILKALGVSFVWTVHNIVNHERRMASREIRASQRLARIVDKLVAHCARAADEVSDAYGISKEKVAIVEHGNYAGHYGPTLAKDKARESLGLPYGETIFLYFGQIREYKGVDRLLQAFERANMTSSRLVIAGESKPSSLGRGISRMAAGNPQIDVLLERLDDETLKRYICASDVVVLPYVESLTSGSAVLAASLGRPIIAPRLGCLAEMPESTAILYDVTGPDKLELAIRNASRKPLEQMGSEARDYVLQYSWSNMARKLTRIYAEILNRDEDGGGP